MQRGRTLSVLFSTILAGGLLLSAGAAPIEGKQFKNYENCTKLNKVYPHGVGKQGAKDHVSTGGKKVTNFKVSNGLYNANSGKDRDGDKIACEKR